MGTNRIEAFSDGVIAIIITIMVLELKVPHDTNPAVLIRLCPQFMSYALSLLVVAIMWVNHHHLMHIAKHANAALLWSNNNLLFWMSLIPFVTTYMGDNHAMPFAVASYGAVLALCGTAFGILRQVITRQRAEDARLTAHNRRINRK